MKWKRVIGWIAAVLLILIVGSGVTGIFVVRSQRFHRYVLAKIVEKGNAATGGTVEIRGYDFHWKKLTAEAYGVIIHGLEKSNEKPLLQVDKLTLRHCSAAVFRAASARAKYSSASLPSSRCAGGLP